MASGSSSQFNESETDSLTKMDHSIVPDKNNNPETQVPQLPIFSNLQIVGKEFQIPVQNLTALEIPKVLETLFKHLQLFELLNARLVCRRWNEVLSTSSTFSRLLICLDGTEPHDLFKVSNVNGTPWRSLSVSHTHYISNSTPADPQPPEPSCDYEGQCHPPPGLSDLDPIPKLSSITLPPFRPQILIYPICFVSRTLNYLILFNLQTLTEKDLCLMSQSCPGITTLSLDRCRIFLQRLKRQRGTGSMFILPNLKEFSLRLREGFNHLSEMGPRHFLKHNVTRSQLIKFHLRTPAQQTSIGIPLSEVHNYCLDGFLSFMNKLTHSRIRALSFERIHLGRSPIFATLTNICKLESFSLTSCSFDESQIGKFIRFLSSHPSLSSLTLEGVEFSGPVSTDDIRARWTLIFDNPSIKALRNIRKLNLSDNHHLSPQFMNFIGRFKSTLTSLNLAGTLFCDELEAFRTCFGNVYPRLRSFGMFPLRPIHDHELRRAIPLICKSFHHLEHLHLAFSRTSDLFIHAYENIWPLWGLVTLRTLIWENSFASDVAFIPALGAGTTTMGPKGSEEENPEEETEERSSQSSFQKIVPDSISALKNLIRLDLSGSNLTNQTIKHGICGLKKLQRLDISGSKVNLDGVRDLCASGSKDLESLHMMDLPIHPRLTKQVLKIICDSFPRLSILRTGISTETISESDIKMIWA